MEKNTRILNNLNTEPNGIKDTTYLPFDLLINHRKLLQIRHFGKEEAEFGDLDLIYLSLSNPPYFQLSEV